MSKSQRKNHSHESWHNFLEICAKIQSPTQLEHFFNLFLTIEEKETLASRYLIVKALVEGTLTQREIADRFGVSISQITRGSNALKIVNDELVDFLKKEIN